MSDSESSESELELTEEELLEAEKSRLEKQKSKTSGGDIVIDLEPPKKPKKTKKYFSPGEFGIELLSGDLGQSYINFDTAVKNYTINEAEIEKKMDIGGDFLIRPKLDYRKSKYAKDKEKQREKGKTTGRRWFDMAAPEITPELKNDLKLLKYSKVLSNDKFFKNEDRRGTPKFFQMGKVMDSFEDFYSSRLTNKERRGNLVDELLADADFKRLQKKRQAKMNAMALANKGKPQRKRQKKSKSS